ncbi:hypothetical protein V6N11_001478 [Hibiscus sabdariffa]|uniref:BED-type domain-containing protein n=1 Tax=Hibiscus sabdariffa TaxID=183260 RepID=A0ABR2RZT4_9ROSI
MFTECWSSPLPQADGHRVLKISDKVLSPVTLDSQPPLLVHQFCSLASLLLSSVGLSHRQGIDGFQLVVVSLGVDGRLDCGEVGDCWWPSLNLLLTFQSTGCLLQMALVAWNVQGLGNKNIVRALRSLNLKYQPAIIFLSETKQKKRYLERVRRKMKMSNSFYVEPEGIAGGLALWWSDDIHITILHSSKNIIDTEISMKARRRADRDSKWCVIGDLNIVANQEEKLGGALIDQNSTKWYLDFLDNTNLLEIPMKGVSFTWSNKRSEEDVILEKLDRALATVEWSTFFDRAIVLVEVAIASDHCPLVLCTDGLNRRGKREFKFESKWLSKEDCDNIVKEGWGSNSHRVNDKFFVDSVDNTSGQDFFGGIDPILDSIKNGGGLPPLLGNGNSSVVNGKGNGIHDSIDGDGLCLVSWFPRIYLRTWFHHLEDNRVHRDYKRSSESRDRGLDNEERCGKRSCTHGWKNDRQYCSRGQHYPSDRSTTTSSSSPPVHQQVRPCFDILLRFQVFDHLLSFVSVFDHLLSFDSTFSSASRFQQSPLFRGMSTIGLGTSDDHSTPIANEFGINLDNANEMDEGEIDLENAEVHVPQTNATNNNSEVRNIEYESESHPFKRAKKSVVWKEFGELERVGNSKVWKVPCVYCKALLTVSKGGPTTHLKHHSDKYAQRKVHIRKQQKLINLLPSDSIAGSPSSEFVSALHDEEGFNMMLKMGIPQWKSVSCHTIRNDSSKVYEIAKNKLKKKLKNRVLNFVHIPPPRKGKDIANCIFKCLKEWDIENKHGLKQVKSIIKNVHETVDYLNGSEQRLKKFSELAQQYNLKERRLVLECKTRWNSTYEMLDCAIKFKEVFARLALEDRECVYCPKLLEILILKMLFQDPSMVTNMKERFDKYWGECNLLMAIGAVLDPRLKMKVIEITFPKMFSPDMVRENIHKVRETLYELYDEYVNLYSPPLMEQMGECGTSANVCGE